jgi:hypothetical protein
MILRAFEPRLLDSDDTIVRLWQRTEQEPEAEWEIARDHTEIGTSRPGLKAAACEQVADAAPREPRSPTKSRKPLSRMRASKR